MQAVLKRHDILFVADEVITGFGRTGNMFGCETYGIQPDILTCAGALGPFLPISATLVSEPIFEAMVAESRKLGTFGHGLHLRRPSGPRRSRDRNPEDLRGARHRRTRAQHRAAFPGAAQGLRRASRARRARRRPVGCFPWSKSATRRRRSIPPGRSDRPSRRPSSRRALSSGAIRDAIATRPPLIITEAQIDTLVPTRWRSVHARLAAEAA